VLEHESYDELVKEVELCIPELLDIQQKEYQNITRSEPMNIPRLPDAELSVMQIIWRHEGEVTSAHIMEGLKGERTWGLTTVLNLLARMVKRGFICMRRAGNMNHYTPLISEADYLEAESKLFVQRFHGGKLRNMVAALHSGDALSLEDIDELKDLINTLEKNT